MIETIRVGDLTVLCARAGRADAPAGAVRTTAISPTRRCWTPWLAFFAARGVPAYAVNLRGRAGSRPGTDLGRVSIDDFVADASAVAQSLERPAVVGHSMGGLIAQRLAERGDVARPCCVTPAPPRGISVLSPRVAIRATQILAVDHGLASRHPGSRGSARPRPELRAARTNRMRCSICLIPTAGAPAETCRSPACRVDRAVRALSDARDRRRVRPVHSDVDRRASRSPISALRCR